MDPELVRLLEEITNQFVEFAKYNIEQALVIAGLERRISALENSKKIERGQVSPRSSYDN